jgi:Rne/Rng family ribonuclease
MSKELVISASAHETRVAILEDGHLCEIYIEREKEFALVGSIYKGRVTRVLPGMQSAFVDIGRDTDAFLYVSDFLENLEEYDHVPAEDDTHKASPLGAEAPTTLVGETSTPHFDPGTAPASGEGFVLEPDSTEGAAAPFETPQQSLPDAGAISSINDSEPVAEQPPTLEPLHREVLPGETLSPIVQPAVHPPFPAERPRGRGFGGGGRDRGGRDRGGRSGFGGRDRGRDRGGRGGSGGRSDRPRGRDLPPSKYAASQSGPPRHTPRSFQSEPSAAAGNLEPIILPGESLAKYKERVPSSGAAPSIGETTGEQAQSSGQIPEVTYSLPETLYAKPETEEQQQDFSAADLREETRESTQEAAREQTDDRHFESVDEALEAMTASRGIDTSSEPAPSVSTEDEWIEFGAPADAGPASDLHHDLSTTGLSEQQARTLAESLTEAKHEEAQAEVDEEVAHPVGGAEFVDENGAAAEGEETSAQDEEANRAQDEAEAAHAAADPTLDDANQPQPFNREIHNQPRSARVDAPRRARFQRPMRRGDRGRDRGGRPPMRHGRPPERAGRIQQRRPQLISEMLKAGQEIIVQIAKEPLGKKGARITSHVALPGRFLVYMPTVNHIGVSRKISSAEMRSRLRTIVGEYKSTFPGGFIVRTAAGNVTEQDLRADIEFLGKTWHEICARSEQKKAPALLHRDLNLVERILRDYVNSDYSSIWIDSEEEFSKVVEFVSRFQPELAGRVKLYTKEAPIFEEFGIQQELDKAMRPKVWLKSGGYIVINHTEALVAIDVNTGKFVGRGSTRLEDTIVKTNVEAVKEIVRQIRLRDLGGIIIVDFIDMEERRNRDKVMHALDDELRADKAPSKVLSFNEFGLVAITRKRTKQALEKVLCQPCPYCTGSGMVKSIPTICYEIQTEAKKMAGDLDAASVTLRVHPEIAKAFKTREAPLVEELETATHKSVIIQSDPTLHWEQYDIF